MDNNVCYIGNLLNNPDYQNKGIGTALMNSIEDYFTGCDMSCYGQKGKNIYLYKSSDIKFLRKKNIRNLTLVYLER